MWADLFDLIPQNLKQQALDTLVDVVSGQAKKLAGDELANKIKKMRSDAAFRETFERGLQQAIQRFAEEYPQQDEDLVAILVKERQLFQNKEVQAALLAILKRPGAYLEEERDKVLDSFVTVLPQRLNRERVDRAVTYLLKCLAEELWHLPELSPLYSLQFQRITAEVSREQLALQRAQLEALSRLDHGVRQALLQLTDAIGEQKLLASGNPTPLLQPPQVLHNLPQPDYEMFVGREIELAQIHQLLRPHPQSRHYLVVIDGIGGIGKSSLALEVAHHYLRNNDALPPAERFDAIIWMSAKRNVLTAEGIKPRRQVMQTLDDIYTAIAVALEQPDITRARPEEQDELVRQTLTRQRTLLIVDNLETVDDETVLTFLRELPDPTKAIVTTRHRIDIAYPIRLSGMPWNDARHLIQQESQRKQVTLSQSETELLYERTGGIPLALVWSIAQVGFGYSVGAVLHRLGQPTNDVAHYCFQAAVTQIRQTPAFPLLLALSLFATDATREALGFVTELSILDRDEGLVTLEKLSLINKLGHRFSLLPLTHDYCHLLFSEQPDLETRYRERQMEYFLNLMRERHEEKDRGVATIKPEIANIRAVIDWCWQEKRLQTFELFLNQFATYLWRTGNSTALTRYYQLGIEASILLENELSQAKLLSALANLRELQGALPEAQKLLEQALLIFKQQQNPTGLIWANYNLSVIYLKRRLFTAANHYISLALATALELENNVHAIRCYCQLARIAIVQGQPQKAQEALEYAQKVQQALPPEQRDSWVSAMLNRLLGQVAFVGKDYHLAEGYYQQSLVIAQAVNSITMEARTKGLMAEL